MNPSPLERNKRITVADNTPFIGCRSTCEEKSFASWEIEAHNIVVIPSLSFCPKELKTFKCIISYEERILFVLFALANPNTKLMIVTSTELDEWTIKYNLSLLPKGLRDNARSRVRFYSLGDPGSEHCLAEKLCGNQVVIESMKTYCAEARAFGKDMQEIVMMIWRATEYEDKLGKLLGLPYYSATPEQSLFGTKQGSRSIFKLLGIPCADGTYEEERDLGELCKSIWKVLRRNPGATKGVVKLAEGFSGMGNAVLDLTRVQERIQTLHTCNSIIDYSSDKELGRLTTLAFENGTFHHRTWDDYCEEIPVMGCVFELFLDVDNDHDAPEPTRNRIVTSPSVQGVIDENGFVSVLSTHEQMLDEQVYLGCEFPCKSEYRLQLLEYGKKVGDFLASAGVRDRYGVDFLCVPKASGQWEIYAVEINLRMTGTTHPWYVFHGCHL
jgi:hypothetical protein